jgi:hypothetical protein
MTDHPDNEFKFRREVGLRLGATHGSMAGQRFNFNL